MKIIATDNGDGTRREVSIEEAVAACEGRGYWKEGTVQEMLEQGLAVWTPFVTYQDAVYCEEEVRKALADDIARRAALKKELTILEDSIKEKTEILKEIEEVTR